MWVLFSGKFAYAKFRENKILEKISEFTITHISQFHLRKYFKPKIVYNFLSINLNMCLDAQKNSLMENAPFEYPQYVLFEK